jgi:hypothetical protein
MKKLTLFAAVALIASTSFAQIGSVRIRQQAAVGQNSQKDRIIAVKPNTVIGAGETKADLKAVYAPICFKYTVTAAQIAALGAATSGNILLTTLPAKSVVLTTTVKQSASVTGGAASGTITSDNTAPSDGDTVTIGTKVYTFKTALTPTEGEVLINSTADAALLNLIRAINHSGTANTDYKVAAANTQVTAATSVTSHAFKVTAITPGSGGNAIATTETSSHLSWGGVVLAGGGTAISAATARVITANNNYGTAFDVFQAPGDTVLDFYATPKSENFAATTAVNLAMTSTGDNLGTVGAGAIEAWVTYYVRP